jgi:hypothetical protein
VSSATGTPSSRTSPAPRVVRVTGQTGLENGLVVRVDDPDLESLDFVRQARAGGRLAAGDGERGRPELQTAAGSGDVRPVAGHEREHAEALRQPEAAPVRGGVGASEADGVGARVH